MKTRLNLFIFCALICGYQFLIGQSDSVKNRRTTTNGTKEKAYQESHHKKKELKSAESFLEIDGLIIDETRSKAGRDFYDHFFQHWEAPSQASNFQITIKELPGRGIQTRILVHLNEEELINTFIQPRYDQIIELAEVAIRFVQGKLIQKMNISHDLDNNDLKGNGIFD